MPESVVLGADLGTSGLKLVALDESGSVVAEAEAAYAVDRPAPDRAETDVRVWVEALTAALGEVAPSLAGRSVRALGFSGQMHGAVLVDDAGRALRPAMLWPDRRATAELDRWRELPEADRAALANPLAPGMTGPMLAWLGRNEPQVLERAAAVLLPKDALRAALLPGTDPRITDRSDASATLLWDVVGDRWSAAAVAAAGVRTELLPTVRPSSEVAGAALLPIGEVPVVVGGADTPLALLAAGTRTGVQINLGTGAQLLRPGWVPRPALDPVVHGYADVDDGWYAMAALQNAGSAWSWVTGVLGLTEAELFDLASSARAGAGGVLFRPFLTGERGGVAGPDDQGGWSGLSADTTRADLARSAVEGVAFAIGAAFGLLDIPDDGQPVVLTGGGTRSPLVVQTLADVLRRPVQAVRLRSASAIGAALLAARGVGVAVTPQMDRGPLVEPRGGPELLRAAERWKQTVRQ